MSNPKNTPSKGREDTTKTDIDATFERLIDLLDGSLLTLTMDQYQQLEKFLPDNRDSDLSNDELAKHVRTLVTKNCNTGDFGNTMTDVYIEVMQASPEPLTKTQLIDISNLLPVGAADGVLSGADYEAAKSAIVGYINGSHDFNRTPTILGDMVTDLIKDMMVKLDTGFSMDNLASICEHYDGKEIVVPTIRDYSNPRETGLLLDDGGETVRFTIPTTRPKALNDLSDDVRKLAEQLETHGYKVDYKAWKPLLKHVPQYVELKGRLKKIEKAVGLTKLRKQIKRMVS